MVDTQSNTFKQMITRFILLVQVDIQDIFLQRNESERNRPAFKVDSKKIYE